MAEFEIDPENLKGKKISEVDELQDSKTTLKVLVLDGNVPKKINIDKIGGSTPSGDFLSLNGNSLENPIKNTITISNVNMTDVNNGIIPDEYGILNIGDNTVNGINGQYVKTTQGNSCSFGISDSSNFTTITKSDAINGLNFSSEVSVDSSRYYVKNTSTNQNGTNESSMTIQNGVIKFINSSSTSPFQKTFIIDNGIRANNETLPLTDFDYVQKIYVDKLKYKYTNLTNVEIGSHNNKQLFKMYFDSYDGNTSINLGESGMSEMITMSCTIKYDGKVYTANSVRKIGNLEYHFGVMEYNDSTTILTIRNFVRDVNGSENEIEQMNTDKTLYTSFFIEFTKN